MGRVEVAALDEVAIGRLVVLLRVLGRGPEAASIARSSQTKGASARAAILADLIVVNLRDLVRCVREDPQVIGAYAEELSRIVEESGDSMDATELESHVNALGLLFASTGRLEECCNLYRWFEKHVEARLDNHARAIFESNFGRVLTWMDDPTSVHEGEVRLRRAVEMEPEFPDHWARLADFLLGADRPLHALEVIQNGLESLPDDPTITACLARLEFFRGRFDQSMALYVASYRMEPDRHERLVFAAQAAGSCGRISDMGELLREVDPARLSDSLLETYELLCLEHGSHRSAPETRNDWLLAELSKLAVSRPDWTNVRTNLDLLRRED